MLLSSHILSEIELIANRMVIISKGKTLVQGNVRELLDEKVLLVSFSVNDQNKAIVILQKEFPNAIQSTSNDQILLHLSKDEIPVCNKLLTDSGISVYSIESKRKLEDYFLKLINS